MIPFAIGLASIGGWEWLIVLAIVLIVFGAGRLPQVFRQFGAGIREFREAQKSSSDDSVDVSSPNAIEADKVVDADEVKEKARA